MFPQLGAPLGFLCSGIVFLVLSEALTDDQFFAYGWRIPFLASALLVLVGLYVRLTITETPVFQASSARRERVRVPVVAILREHATTLVVGTAAAMTTFAIFYLMTVFLLSWGTTALGYTRERFLVLQLIGVVFFGLTIPVSAIWAERHGRRRTLIGVTVAIAVFGLVLAPIVESGTAGVLLAMIVGLGLMGFTYGPLGTVLSELFPTAVRYTGSSLTFNLAGIFGASLAPYAATWLAERHGLAAVGYYLSAVALISLLGFLAIGETRDRGL
jgi:MFS family permease